MARETTQMARRFVIASLLALLAPIVLFAPQAYAESYVAGQLGATFPLDGLSNGDVTTTGVPFQNGPISGTVNFPSGTTISDQSMKNSFMFGGKIGHYFSRARWLGLEAEVFYSTPDTKQQDIRLRSDTPFTFTPSGGGPSTPLGNELPPVVFAETDFQVLTIAPLNLMFRYPRYRLQPYIGIGPGIFIARLKDSSVTQGENTQSSTKLGLNTLIGIRYFLTRHVSAFAEGKYNYVRFSFAETGLIGFDATYTPISVAFGVSYHF